MTLLMGLPNPVGAVFGKIAPSGKYKLATSAEPMGHKPPRRCCFTPSMRATASEPCHRAERFQPAGKGAAFPIAIFDTFTTYGGPANLLESASTMGLPHCVHQHRDEKGSWIALMTEVLILPVNKRPRLALRLHRSN